MIFTSVITKRLFFVQKKLSTFLPSKPHENWTFIVFCAPRLEKLRAKTFKKSKRLPKMANRSRKAVSPTAPLKKDGWGGRNKAEEKRKEGK